MKTIDKASTVSWADKSVKSGTQYKYTVRAVNGKVLSSYNKTGAATLYLAQPTVKIANASTGVKVSWSKVTGATGYTVYRSEYKNGAWTKWASRGTAKANKTSWTDTKVTSGVQYKYTVRAINGKYKSTYISSNTVLYLAQPNVTVKAVSNGIKVAWTQSTGATGYTVYRMEYNAKTKKWSGWKKMGTAKASKTNWTDKSAKKGVQYKYTVKAVNGNSASTYKSSSSVKR
jgi:fibronectin type 3 domain-containing protein